MSQHTPTPWIARVKPALDGSGRQEAYIESAETGEHIAIINQIGDGEMHTIEERQKNNIEFIVRTVNEYEGNINTIDGLQLILKNQEQRTARLLVELKSIHSHYHPECKGGCPTWEIIQESEGVNL